MSEATVSGLGDGDRAWWYQEGGETKGPVTGAELLALIKKKVLDAGTMVWREDYGNEWRQLAQTGIFGSQAAALPDDKTLSARWQKIFHQFDESTGFYYSWSPAAFFLGPLYYFYRRMWRKGLLIFGITLSGNLILLLVHAFLDAPDLMKISPFLANCFCSIFARRDYYKLKRFDERVWPPLARFGHPYAVAAVVLLPIVLFMLLSAVADSMADDDAPTKRVGSESTFSPMVAAASEKPISSTYASSLTPLQKRLKAEASCQKWFEENMTGETTNPYDDSITYSYQFTVRGGYVERQARYFGNHPTMTMNVHEEKLANGQLKDDTSLPYHICVLDNDTDLNVIGVELEMQNGLN